MRWLVLLVAILLHTSALAEPVPEGLVQPTPEQLGRAFHRSRMLGRGGTVMASLAVPVTLVGLGFANSDTVFAVSGGRGLMVAGIASAVLGVPIMAHAAGRGANTLRLADPAYRATRLNAVWGLHAAAVGFGVVAVATAGRGGPEAAWLWRTPGLTVMSSLCAVTGFAFPQIQLRANVDKLGRLAAEGAVERYRRPQAQVMPLWLPNGAGLGVAGAF